LHVSALTLRSRTTVALLGAATLAWVLVADRMTGMDDGPGTDLGGARWFLGIWVLMTAAMMLPSTVRLAPTALFAVGYLAAWTAYGLAAYLAFRLVTSFDTGWLAWDAGGPYAAGGAIVAAGLYELTPLKRRSLRRCRSPHEEATPFQCGVAHGVDCVGCSAGLMVVLFTLGVMSLVWMGVVAAAVFAEKVLPQGPRLSRAVAVALLVLGLWVAMSPGSVPGLTEPVGAPSMELQS
jgi:predicted metal-binding membrane protein